MLRLKPSHYFLVLILAVFFILSLLAYERINSLLLPVSSSTEGRLQEINIPFNSSTAHVAAILQQEGIIKSGLVFRLYARYKGYDQKLQAGSYLLFPGMPLEEILDKLQQGVIWEKGLRFTIPEGFTVEQIAARLEKEGLAEKEAFLNACLEYDREELFDFPEAVPPGVKYPLEGYLFPDTYEIREGLTAEEIAAVMLRRFNEVFHEAFRLRASELGFSVHEVVTIASLVEKEARVPLERPLISAVFHNRLQSNYMPFLQSCATVQYVLGETRPFLTYQDLEVDSPYNTYLYPNLPPGPIASPGREALEAALYPADVNYLYFVYKEDGSGEHYFSTTLQEHNHHKSLAQRNRNKR
ncbi:MAG: endolytic transglycosylase MltG [Dethiobacter sp.]|jgi:UPF0755 protein|nr:MAG: endolytic transglycosylase MltG [Dethiobacter sp.]